MGKKAKNNHTPEHPQLDNDALWMPLVEAVALLIKRVGSIRGALRRIEKAMASGKLPSMREDFTKGKREHRGPEFWKANIIYYEEKEPSYVSVIPGSRTKLGWNIWASDPRDEDGGHDYFVSRTHFELLLPAPQPQAGGEEAAPMRVVAPGPKPKDDWPRWVARWLILKATRDDPNELQNVDALVEEARAWLKAKKIFAPKDNKQIRREIADLLVLVRR